MIQYIISVIFYIIKTQKGRIAMDGLKIGTKAQANTQVNASNTALSMGSGALEVFATPAAVALVEAAACKVLAPYLEEGITTVGTKMNIDHIKASPLGAMITATAELIEIDGRRYVFAVSARDEAGEIVVGTHERFSVNVDRFMSKLR